RPGDAERQARLDSHAVSEPRLAGRKLLQQVVLRKRMDERHGSCGEIEREAAIPLPAEEMLVSAAQRQPNRPVGSDAVGLTAGPTHLAHPGKPFGPGFSIFEDREHLSGPCSQLHRVLEAHGSSLEERKIDGVAGKAHGAASSLTGRGAIEAWDD